MRGTIGRLLLRSFRVHAKRVAWRIHNTSGPDVETLTYAELGSRALDAAGGFATLGLARGDVVGIIADSSSERMLAEIGCLLAGLQPLNLPADLPSSQVSQVLREAGARAVVASPKRKAIDDSEGERPTVILSGAESESPAPPAPGHSQQLMADLLQRGHAFRNSASGQQALAERLQATPPDSPAVATLSTGASGAARLMTLSHAVLTHQVNSLPPATRLTQHDVVLAPSRPWHAFHQLCSWSTLAVGATLAWYVTDDIPSLSRALAAICPTVAVLDATDLDALRTMARTPARNRGLVSRRIHSLLLDAGQLRWHAQGDARGLRRINGRLQTLQRGWMRTSGLVRLALLHQPARLADRTIFTPLRQRMGNRLRAILTWGTPSTLIQDSLLGEAGVEILEAYGLLEVAPVVAIRRSGRAVPQTVGPPLPGLDLRVVDSSDRPCGSGQAGELLIHDPAFQPRANEAAHSSHSNGWRRTGDRAMLTDAGNLAILGRQDALIRLADSSELDPLPIERHLEQSPLIQHCILVSNDRGVLGALILPDLDELAVRIDRDMTEAGQRQGLLQSTAVRALYRNELHRLAVLEIHGPSLLPTAIRSLMPRSGNLFEVRFQLLDHALVPGSELTLSGQVMRQKLAATQGEALRRLFSSDDQPPLEPRADDTASTAEGTP